MIDKLRWFPAVALDSTYHPIKICISLKHFRRIVEMRQIESTAKGVRLS